MESYKVYRGISYAPDYLLLRYPSCDAVFHHSVFSSQNIKMAISIFSLRITPPTSAHVNCYHLHSEPSSLPSSLEFVVNPYDYVKNYSAYLLGTPVSLRLAHVWTGNACFNCSICSSQVRECTFEHAASCASKMFQTVKHANLADLSL